MLADFSALLLHNVALEYTGDAQDYQKMPTFSNLSHLALVDVDIYETSRTATDWTAFLNPTTFPNLSSLWLMADKAHTIDAVSFERALVLVAPQLESFVFAEGNVDPWPNFRDAWRELYRVACLSLHVWRDNYCDILDALHELPSPSLLSLEFVAPAERSEGVDLFEAIEKLKEVLEASSPSLSSLKAVVSRGWSEKESATLWDDEEEVTIYKQNSLGVQRLLGEDALFENLEERPVRWEEWIEWR